MDRNLLIELKERFFHFISCHLSSGEVPELPWEYGKVGTRWGRIWTTIKDMEPKHPSFPSNVHHFIFQAQCVSKTGTS